MIKQCAQSDRVQIDEQVGERKEMHIIFGTYALHEQLWFHLYHTLITNSQHMSPNSQEPVQYTHIWQCPSRKSQASCSQWVYAPSIGDGRALCTRDHPGCRKWKMSWACSRKRTSSSEKGKKCIDRWWCNLACSRQKRPHTELSCGHYMEENKWAANHFGSRYR